MNRALLERMRSYQPHRTIVLEPARRTGIVFYVVGLGVVAVIVWTFFLLSGCKPTPAEVGTQVDVAAGGTEYGSEILGCYLSVKDGGTFRDFQKCACGVDRKYQLDASSAGAECAP